jgi:opacity protein-like surface antigen
MKTINKTLGMTAAISAVLIAGLAPQAVLADKYKSKGTSAQADIERRLQMMEEEMKALRSELARARSESKANAEQIEAHQQQVEQQLAASKEDTGEKKDFLFFRGGFASMEHGRNNELLLNNDRLNALGLTSISEGKEDEGWYVGAGFDHRLTDNTWGMMDGVAVDGEVMFEYKNFGTSHNSLVEAATDTIVAANGIPLPAGTNVRVENQLTQFTLTASPKIKFTGLGDFRPWIIPFGLGIHVISPPSSGVTVLNPGLMVGAGAEYKLWESLYAGFDFRYHFTGDDLAYKAKAHLPNGTTVDVYNKTRTDGFTTGAYLGFGF